MEGKHFAKPYSTTDAIDTHTHTHTHNMYYYPKHTSLRKESDREGEEDREGVVGRRKGL